MVRRTRRVRGAGYQTSQQYFNPDVLQPEGSNVISSAATAEAIRPVLNSTFKVGGRRGLRSRRSRRSRNRKTGGFSPSVMGSFLRNAQNAIVPLTLYTAYHFMPKKGRNTARKSKRV